MIAATAIEQSMTLVTNNSADYLDIPDLAVEEAGLVSTG
jgi:predicted nucleic acid-binding protein